MKKLLGIILALVLALALLFFWKGGHHALYLAERLEEWAEPDGADQYMTVQINGLAFTADTFWTEYQDRRIFGLTAGGCTAYLLNDTLYMDTGKAYGLPGFDLSSGQLRELITGLVLYGRVTKSDNVYTLTMDTEELSLSASVTLDKVVSSISLNADGTVDGAPVHLLATLTPKEPTSHPIPMEVLDAMVLARMETPMPITEPLEILLPALSDLDPFDAEVTMGVSCGILNLSETVALRIADGQATLTRDGAQIDIDLPNEFTEVSPVAAGLLLLRNGDFTRSDDDAAFTLALPGETTAQLAEALIPQAANLGITFKESTAVLTIHDRALTGISLTAEGSIPFLITEIPVSFSAEFDIQ